MENFFYGKFLAYMLSAIIFYKRNHSAMQKITQQPTYQRFTKFGPLVLEFKPFNFQHL
jgi:hypothetical protein